MATNFETRNTADVLMFVFGKVGSLQGCHKKINIRKVIVTKKITFELDTHSQYYLYQQCCFWVLFEIIGTSQGTIENRPAYSSF